MNIKISILGGGISGLSVAHNLSIKGFKDITIYEKNANTGGMARSNRLMKNELDKRPFNYSWRVLGKGYYNLRAILRKILTKGGTVEDLFVDMSKHWVIINNEIVKMDTSISTILKFYGHLKSFCFDDFLKISNAYLYSVTACDERIDTHDNETWSSFIGSLSQDARMMMVDSCGPIFGVDYHKVNATSILTTLNTVSAFIPGHNQILSTTWDTGVFQPWEDALKKRGVKIRLKTSVDKIDVKDDEIEGFIADGERIKSDIYFICLPVEQAHNLLKQSRLERSLSLLRINGKQLMTNLTVYFEERIYMKGEGTGIYLPQSPWKLIIQPCGEVWKENIYRKYGVGDIWFIGICCSECLGILHEKSFSNCSIEEATSEVLCQIRSYGLDKHLTTSSGKKFSEVEILETKMWETFYDDALNRISTTEPKFSTNVNTLKYSPIPRCPEISNAYFATAYCKTSRRTFLMDNCAEAAGIACNAFFDDLNSDVERVKIYETKPRFSILKPLRALDRVLFTNNISHIRKICHPLVILLIYFYILGYIFVWIIL
uniref:Flavin-containing amine oxidase n=1 Tax=Pithovirus LCPAC403 TaxID=2506596 RepID=A0A481ZBB1_9VIRU|nr:MAG: flavin-containing amine oxidase [Pithovirus LCPAC403]